MNNSGIEGAFKTWLAGAGLGVAILEGEGFDEIPTDARAVIVEVGELRNSVGPLYVATIHLRTTSPAPFVTLAQHRATADAVDALVQGYAASPDALDDAVEAAGGTMRGLVVRGVSNNTSGGRWITSREILAGLQSA